MIEEGFERQPLCTEQEEQNLLREKVAEYNQVLLKYDAYFTVEELEEAMQKSWIPMQAESAATINIMKRS